MSALDVSIQAQIVNLLTDLRDDLSLTMVFIAHDLAVVRHVATRVAVMYLGRLVEVGTRDELFANPAHPYTRALLRAVPPPDPTAGWNGQDVALHGDIPSPVNPPSGCRFHTRCPEAIEICRTCGSGAADLALGAPGRVSPGRAPSRGSRDAGPGQPRNFVITFQRCSLSTKGEVPRR